MSTCERKVKKDVQPSNQMLCSSDEASSRGDWYRPCVFDVEGEFKIEEFFDTDEEFNF